MIIDIHEHFSSYEDLLKLRDVAQSLNIDRVCMFGTSPEHNEKVRKAIEKYPDFLIGFAVVKLGMDNAQVVNYYYEQGFKGLKAINPLVNYDDPLCYCIYARAEDFSMPILFHTGIMARGKNERSKNISSARMRPIYLDTIARAFPDLKIIGAHLGNPWYEEAAEVARWNPNVFFDLTGSTLKKNKPEFFNRVLWWSGGRYGREPFEQIVFGSDESYNLIEDVMNDYQNLMNELNLSKELQKKVMGETAAEILNLG